MLKQLDTLENMNSIKLSICFSTEAPCLGM